MVLVIFCIIGLIHNCVGEVITQAKVANAEEFAPEHQHNVLVILNGQCDPNIEVVEDFDISKYMGQWNYIESYSISQEGGCLHDNYALNEDLSIDVVNSRILDQTLHTINGVGVLESDGKLSITYLDSPTPVDYWILATDYDSYSLVYSCHNINADQKEVNSWKLSRTNELSEEAILVIDEKISEIEDLDQVLYTLVDRTPEACFYYPDPDLGEPIVFPGQCERDIRVVPNFNIAAYMGRWRVIESYPSEFQDGECLRATYTLNAFSLIGVFHSRVDNNTLFNSEGVGFVEGNARFTVYIFSNQSPADYWILETDYSSYALVYSCQNVNSEQRRVFSWKLSRTTELSEAASQAIDNRIAEEQILDQRYFSEVDHSPESCFFYPNPIPGVPVTFPGQCDENIGVIQNFNIEAYMGRWYLIESYPSDLQNGGCNQATYSLNDDSSIDVLTSNVLNETLYTINGEATLEDDGILIVTSPDSATPSIYWVLDTDYDSYALVYSCENINAEQRRVHSWKLSRTNQLSTAAVQAIDALIENIEVLDDRYYYPVDQSEESCFYYPEPVPGVPVVFPGQCDENLEVIGDFDVEAYMGRWYLIESYPSDLQGGCIQNNYNHNSDVSVEILNSRVENETLFTNYGTGVVQDNGIISITFSPDSSLDYWVLDTDYDSYALVYSCENIDEERRRVQSWKLSRSSQLTDEAIQAIEARLANIQVLDQRYYQSVDQSQDACFYFPDPAYGVPVVFPGQCEENLEIVTNFDLDAYLGRWHLIESYPSNFQDGGCNQATYSIREDTIEVFYSRVDNQTLHSITGAAIVEDDGILQVSFPSSQTTADYWILDTDYSSYALVYSCSNINAEQRQVYSWKLSRSDQLAEAAIQAIDNRIQSIQVLDERYYAAFDQSPEACFYLPDLEPGQITIFPGQCDDNIEVVQNFNITAYMGRWNLIESYPFSFQNGGCDRTTYTLNSNLNVDILYSHVENETLHTITGEASVRENGKIIVTFPNSDTPVEYWVLDTDYESFALVYSCKNINLEQRQVFSWKLSRTNQLSQTAIQAIDNKISEVQVLDQRYYYTVDRSPEACFYYPEPQQGVPITFPGQCSNVNTVQDFNLTAARGTRLKTTHTQWYQTTVLVLEYLRLNYNDTTGLLDVLNWQHIDDELAVIEGVASAANDGSGRITLIFQANPDDEIATDIYILATDYTHYSFAYACRNIDEDLKSILAVKLSRTRAMTEDGNTAINNIMEQRPELDQRYFSQVEQSDDCQDPNSSFFIRSSINIILLCILLPIVM